MTTGYALAAVIVAASPGPAVAILPRMSWSVSTRQEPSGIRSTEQDVTISRRIMRIFCPN
jgi:hypothetical protein